MIVVIGAGAAGLAAAIFAREHGAPVTVVESTSDGGRKILISGGGRCNVLPAALEPQRFVTDSPPRLVARFLRSWPLKAQIAFFERDVGVPLAFEAGTRKWFPESNRARDVRDGLIALARRAGVEFAFTTRVRNVRPAGSGWVVDTDRGPIEASRVIVATGGLSVPATGSAGDGLTIAASLGHTVHDPYAALTPLLAPASPYASLSGVSLDVRVRAEAADGRDRAEAAGGFLFTHRGYSGPSVLDVSHVETRARARGAAASLRVRWCERTADAWHADLIGASPLVVNIVGRHLPQRLAERLVADAGVPLDRRGVDLRREERLTLVDRLTNAPLACDGDEGYKKAEVTGGGVALDEVDPRTLESTRCPGLHFCGEVLDAFGPIGGHNFAWAWATGKLAGSGAAKSASP
jgi:predicted Rossmann fold flavoprotein